ncbi:MAG: hypothetical protein K1X83_04465 [Oligoflexia bacterium]|nr:hypothetical protein [Oligoflexia bacterium]
MANSIIAAGLSGIKAGLAAAAEDADRASKAFLPGNENADEFVTAAIGLEQDQRQVQASAKVVKVGDNLNQAILDILA